MADCRRRPLGGQAIAPARDREVSVRGCLAGVYPDQCGINIATINSDVSMPYGTSTSSIFISRAIADTVAKANPRAGHVP